MGGLHYSEMKDLIPKLINNIEEGGQRIKQIVSDLKDYARQDSDYQFKPLMLNDVVQAALRLTKNKTKNATQNLQVSLQPDLPLIQGNSRRLEQVIINLINNSCEALADKEKSISIITSYDSNVNLVKLRIGDEGCGIDPQALTKITDPFYTSKRHQGGTGLGLSVSAGIIKEHRGHLHFTSKTGQGTTATITFTNHEPDTIPSHTAD
jgi:polar amino acid transport system substrate-binding protein